MRDYVCVYGCECGLLREVEKNRKCRLVRLREGFMNFFYDNFKLHFEGFFKEILINFPSFTDFE